MKKDGKRAKIEFPYAGNDANDTLERLKRKILPSPPPPHDSHRLKEGVNCSLSRCNRD
jgi:hypothetical protein